MVIENENHKLEGSNPTENQSSKKSDESKPAIPSPNPPPNTPTTTKGQGNAYQEKNYRLAKRQFIVATLTLIALFIYTGIAAYQGCQMKRTTDTAGKSAKVAEYALRVSERAYLDISYPSVDFSDSAFGKPTTYRIRITNKGRTPATNVVCQMSATSAWPPEDAGRPTTWSELYPDASVDCVIVSDFIFTKQIKRNYVTGIVKRHVHGFISYDTVFKDERGIPVSERRNYCFQYCPRLHGFTTCGEPNTELQCYEKQNLAHGPN